jgi:hypothetical protein
MVVMVVEKENASTLPHQVLKINTVMTAQTTKNIQDGVAITLKLQNSTSLRCAAFAVAVKPVAAVVERPKLKKKSLRNVTPLVATKSSTVMSLNNATTNHAKKNAKQVPPLLPVPAVSTMLRTSSTVSTH